MTEHTAGPSIARAALNAADNCVNYAIFDSNGDNQITPSELMPIIIVAGYESSYGGTSALPPNVWGHQGAANYNSVTDDVTVVPYAQFGEWHAATWDSPGHRATIGLIVHEVGHLLGWPDLYDTLPPGQPDSEGVGDWSLMGSGLWRGGVYLGDTPAHPSAWEKWYQNGTETATGSKVIAWPPTTIAATATITRTFQVTVSGTITDGDTLANIVSVSSAQGIKIENSEYIEIVGNRPMYLPSILLNH